MLDTSLSNGGSVRCFSLSLHACMHIVAIVLCRVSILMVSSVQFRCVWPVYGVVPVDCTRGSYLWRICRLIQICNGWQTFTSVLSVRSTTQAITLDGDCCAFWGGVCLCCLASLMLVVGLHADLSWEATQAIAETACIVLCIPNRRALRLGALALTARNRNRTGNETSSTRTRACRPRVRRMWVEARPYVCVSVQWLSCAVINMTRFKDLNNLFISAAMSLAFLSALSPCCGELPVMAILLCLWNHRCVGDKPRVGDRHWAESTPTRCSRPCQSSIGMVFVSHRPSGTIIAAVLKFILCLYIAACLGDKFSTLNAATASMNC